MAFRSGSSLGYTTTTSAAVPVPSGAASGDIAVVDLFVEWASGTATPPTGFTLDTSFTRSGAQGWIHYQYWKRLTAADTGTWAFGISASSAVMAGASLYSGRIATGSPFDTGTGATTTAGTSGTSGVAAPILTRTPTTAGVDLVYTTFTYNNGGAVTPAGWTTAAGHADGVMQAYKANQAATATGNVQATSPASDLWTAFLSVLLPAAAGGAVTGDAAPAVAAAVSAAGTLQRSGGAAPTPVVAVSAVGVKGLSTAAAPAVAVTVSAAGTVTATPGTATPSTAVAVTATGTAQFAGTATRAATVGVTAAGTTQRVGAAGRTAAVAVTASGTVSGTSLYVTSVSGNGRYFLDQNGSPLLVHGDTAWSMLVDLSASEVDTYLANRVALGTNALIMGLIGSVDLGGANNNGATYDGVLPFNSGNITSFNSTYWSRMDSYLGKCRDAGVTVFLYVMDGWNTKAGCVFDGKSTTDCQTYGNTVATRYALYPNIVWMMGGDYDGGGSPGTFADAQFNACLTGIRAAGDTRPFSIQLDFRRSNSFDTSYWEQRADASFAYTYFATYDAVLAGYAKTWTATGGKPPKRPVFFGEGEYDNSPVGDGGSAAAIRRQAGWSLTSGACGAFTGQEGVWQFGGGWASLLSSAQSAQFADILGTFAAMPKWHLLVPDTGSALVTAGRGTPYVFASDSDDRWTSTSDYVTAAVTPDKSLAVIYNPNTVNAITISASAVGANPTLRRVDPSTGVSTGMTWTTTPTASTNSAGQRDWLFIIEADPASVAGDATRATTVGVTATGTKGLSTGANPAPAVTVTTTGSRGVATGTTPGAAVAVTVDGVVAKASTATPAVTVAAVATGQRGAATDATVAVSVAISADGFVSTPGASGATPSASIAITVGGVVARAGTATPALSVSNTVDGQRGASTGTAIGSTVAVTAAGSRGAATGTAASVAVGISADGTVTSGGASGAVPATSVTVTASGSVTHPSGATPTALVTVTASGGIARASGSAPATAVAVVASGLVSGLYPIVRRPRATVTAHHQGASITKHHAEAELS